MRTDRVDPLLEYIRSLPNLESKVTEITLSIRACRESKESWACDAANQLAVAVADIHFNEDLAKAKDLYADVLTILTPSHIRGSVMNNYGRVLLDLGENNKARQVMEACLHEIEHDKTQQWPTELFIHLYNNIGLAYHRQGRAYEELARQSYEKGLAINEFALKGELLYNLGVSLKNLGRHEEALYYYSHSLKVNPAFVPVHINIAALYHEHQMIPEAMERYQKVIQLCEPGESIRRMSLINLGTAYMELGDAKQSIDSFLQALREIPDDEFEGEEINIRAKISVTRRISCDWTNFDHETNWLQRNVEVRELQKGLNPSFLPFDSLLRSFPNSFRKRLASMHANHYGYEGTQPKLSPAGARVRVGYLSYDFNDHPTAHLCEELFDLHRLYQRIDSYTLSYGKNDNSTFRRRIETAGTMFKDLSTTSHAETVRVIRDELGIEILMDMQGFTRGGRPEVVAARPSPIIVNYLVFAGTSGARFIDYFIGDHIASPLAEHASHFSEKLVLMPHSYQVNAYRKTVEAETELLLASQDRISYCSKFDELAGASFVFVNFNKNDKHEPVSFESWMQILQRVPGSILWLLEPSRRLMPELTIENLSREARARGVDPSRLRYAPHTTKAEHVARHVCGDLFLDTLVYGAHSTATDALRGGLPVLTVAGDAFASRVAASLVSSLGMGDYLITHSAKEFIETAAEIALRPGLAAGIKARQRELLDKKPPLFDVESYTRDLESAFRTMIDLRLIGGTQHILLRSSSRLL